MIFNDIIADIEKLVGLELHSVRPGAKIVIKEIDKTKGCLILCTPQGQYRSRPISELETIWDEMMKNSAVHVEGVLHGSGTSRNQPETILANLPYIEWLKIKNKKHIAFVGNNTHAYGTLKQMDSVTAAELSEKVNSAVVSNQTRFVVVSPDVQAAIIQMQGLVSGTVSAIEPGIYSFEGNGFVVLFVAVGKCDLISGCYTILNFKPTTILPKVNICDEDYFVVEADSFKALIRV